MFEDVTGISFTHVPYSGAAPAVQDLLAGAGVKGFEAYAVQGVVAPAGTPKELVARLNAEINEVLRSANVAKRFAEMGMIPSLGTPEQLMAQARKENEAWGRLIKAKGIRIE